MWTIRPIRCQIVQFSLFTKSPLSPRHVYVRTPYNNYFQLYLRAFASSVFGLSLFRSFRCLYTLNRHWLYDCRKSSSCCTNPTTTQQPMSVCITAVQTHLTHSGEHSTSWSTLQCKLSVCHVVAYLPVLPSLFESNAFYLSTSVTCFHLCPSECIS
jgi:hypothetical protein